ncbi:MAG: hypothetical protein KYX69_04370 [Sphingomonas sp.]|uniref:hypothetical protein n=1 Tax=Sphingomonas sp. TaxID=28214 RepID=UPI002616304F|nr:hypothetical protein [Sphingomonas sp.]MDK2766936.1 hypothetical protein [Sphingomonas sp.]
MTQVGIDTLGARSTLQVANKEYAYDLVKQAAEPEESDLPGAVTCDDGSTFSFSALCRLDTANEAEYFMHGGILHYVLRKLAA